MNLCQKNQDVPCVPGEGVTEARNINIGKGVCGGFASLIKLSLLTSSLASTATLLGIFDEFVKADCSDAVTIKALSEFALVVKAVHNANTTALYMDILTLIMSVIGWVIDLKAGCKPDFTVMINPPASHDLAVLKKQQEDQVQNSSS